MQKLQESMYKSTKSSKLHILIALLGIKKLIKIRFDFYCIIVFFLF